MPAPANISQRFRQMLDDAWDAKATASPFTDIDLFIVQGEQVILRMDFDPQNLPNYQRLTAWLKWLPT